MSRLHNLLIMEPNMKSIASVIIIGSRIHNQSLKTRNVFELLYVILFCLLVCKPFVTTVQGEITLSLCQLCNCTSQRLQCNNRTPTLREVPSQIPINIIELDASHNTLTKITMRNFANLEELQILNLNNNRITDIEANSFQDLQSLREIDLSNNRLKVISDMWFQHLLSIAVINLQSNQIEKIETYAFLTLPASQNSNVSIQMSNNTGVTCSCDLVKMNEWLNTTNGKSNMSDIHLQGIRCANLESRELGTVTSSELLCDNKIFLTGGKCASAITGGIVVSCSSKSVCYTNSVTNRTGCESTPYSCLRSERNNTRTCRPHLPGNCYFCCKGDSCNTLTAISAGKNCTDGDKCAQFAKCVSGKCQCNEFHYNNNGNCEQRIRSGETCNSNISDVTQCVQHAVCRSDKCECTEMYFNNNGKCEMNVKAGEYCNESLPDVQKCVINSYCQSGICQCNESYYNNLGRCDLRIKAGELCNNSITDNKQCVEHAFCQSNVCECNGTHFNSAGTCDSPISAGLSCDNNNTAVNQCVQNASCQSGTCTCHDSHYNRNGNCQPRLVADQNCNMSIPDENQCVQNAYCTLDRCRCIDAYYAFKGVCHTRIAASLNCKTSIPDPNQCVQNARCTSAGCTCTDAYHASQGACHPRIQANLSCNQDNSDSKQCVQDAVCSKGVCECLNTYTNVNGACVQSQGQVEVPTVRYTAIIILAIVGVIVFVIIVIIFKTSCYKGVGKLCCQVKPEQDDGTVVYRHFEEQRVQCRISWDSNVYDVIPGTPHVSMIVQESPQNSANVYIDLINEPADARKRNSDASTYDHPEDLSPSCHDLITKTSVFLRPSSMPSVRRNMAAEKSDLIDLTCPLGNTYNELDCWNLAESPEDKENCDREIQSYLLPTVPSTANCQNTSVAVSGRASPDILQSTQIAMSGRASPDYLQPIQESMSGRASPDYLQPTQVAVSGRASPYYLHPTQVALSGRASPTYLHPTQEALSGRASPTYLHPTQEAMGGRASPTYLQPTQEAMSGRASPDHNQPIQVAMSGRASPDHNQPIQVAVSGRASPDHNQPIKVDLGGGSNPIYL